MFLFRFALFFCMFVYGCKRLYCSGAVCFIRPLKWKARKEDSCAMVMATCSDLHIVLPSQQIV